MQESKAEEKHELHLSDCGSGKITGIREVLAFDPEEIRLDTVCGRLLLRGKQLHISQLSVETGCVTLTGTVDSVQYLRKTAAKNAEKSVFKRLFQ